ncbi:MAG: hypothetical protein ACRD4F_15070 [Candidatus Angelobacter sp.]
MGLLAAFSSNQTLLHFRPSLAAVTGDGQIGIRKQHIPRLRSDVGAANGAHGAHKELMFPAIL